VVYFAGGPGDSAVADIPAELPLLQSLNVQHDLVFIDQRGTGGAHPLDCPAPPTTLADKALLEKSVTDCLHALSADIRYYTTAMFADDVSEVLSALHYPTANIVGGSYGATAAQVFQRLHPSQVRTMTLLQGTLVNVPIFEVEAANSQAALDQVFSRCEQDSLCNGAFPNLVGEWAALRASIAASPVLVPASASPNGRSFQFNSDLLASTVHQLLLSANTAADLPLLIHTLAASPADERAAVLGQMIKAIPSATSSSDNYAVINYPIQCGEPWAALEPGQITDGSSFEFPLDVETANWWQYVCTLVPSSTQAAHYGAAVKSQVPVLAISGGADPQDPPSNMAGANTLWSNSRVLAVPGLSHENSFECEPLLLYNFVQQADASGLDASCIATITLPVFPLSLQSLSGQ